MREVKMAESGWLTTEGAAARRKVNPRTVLRWVASDLLPVLRVPLGTERYLFLFRVSDVDAVPDQEGPGRPRGYRPSRARG